MKSIENVKSLYLPLTTYLFGELIEDVDYCYSTWNLEREIYEYEDKPIQLNPCYDIFYYEYEEERNDIFKDTRVIFITCEALRQFPMANNLNVEPFMEELKALPNYAGLVLRRFEHTEHKAERMHSKKLFFNHITTSQYKECFAFSLEKSNPFPRP